MKILDSDHCVAILRGQLKLSERASSAEKLATTVISVGELTQGVYKSSRPAKNQAALDVLLATIDILPLTEKAGRIFGQLKANLEQTGIRLSDLDLQIASIALDHKVPLVTHNQHHFDPIPGLLLEDWLEHSST